MHSLFQDVVETFSRNQVCEPVLCGAYVSGGFCLFPTGLPKPINGHKLRLD